MHALNFLSRTTGTKLDPGQCIPQRTSSRSGGRRLIDIRLTMYSVYRRDFQEAGKFNESPKSRSMLPEKHRLYTSKISSLIIQHPVVLLKISMRCCFNCEERSRRSEAFSPLSKCFWGGRVYCELPKIGWHNRVLYLIERDHERGTSPNR